MIEEVYSRIIFQDLLRDRFIDLGISPNLTQLKALENQAHIQNPGRNGSMIKYEPGFESIGTSAAMNAALETFSMEMQAIRQSSDLLKSIGQRTFDLINNTVALLNQDAINITLQICTFELARQKNMFLNNWDSFVSLDKINQQETTADIDTEARSVKLRRQPFDTRHDLTHLKSTDFNVLVVDGEYIGLNLMEGSDFTNMTDDTESFWRHQVLAKETGEKTLGLEVNLKKVLNISRIKMTTLDANSEAGIGVRVLMSPDGTQWQEMASRRFFNSVNVEIETEPVNGQYLRIELTRLLPSYQSGIGEINYVYEFGLDNLSLYSTKYNMRSQVMSKPITFERKLIEGRRLPINRIQVNASEYKPVGTDIIYYVSTNNNPDFLTRVVPGEEISFNTVLESRNDQADIRSRFDTNHALINLDLNSEYIPESVRFFRNTLQQNVFIDTVHAGWKFEDSYYSCIFELDEELEIDLGINFAFIDGKKRNGITILSAGFHTFRTHEVNWKIAQTEDNDPLFPHNHKLLIEGLSGSSVYKGVDFMAAEELKMVSVFDLIKNIDSDDFGFFAIRGLVPMIKIQKPPTLSDTIEGWRFEQHAVRYKYKDEGLEDIQSITLVAKLATNDPQFTPVFRGYTIVAGF